MENPSLPWLKLWEMGLFQKKKSPCEAEGEEKARYPQGLRGKIYELVC